MTSIGYTNSIGGSNAAFSIFASNPASSGGAIKGWMPPDIMKTDKTYPEFESIRFTLKNAWNTHYRGQLKNQNIKKSMVTPFRAINNSGDLLCRKNYTCGGSCQTFQSRPGLKGLRKNFGATQNNCVPSDYYNTLQVTPNVPSATCNVKYVYDSSDYITYLKQKAVNKNFNNISYGGNKYHTSQSAIRAIRRY